MEQIRPSTLPKKELCPCFEPDGKTSEAAERGTRLDECIRKAWKIFSDIAQTGVADVKSTARNVVIATELVENDDEIEACTWAVESIHNLAGDSPFETAEDALQAVVPVEGIKSGTMDGLCAERTFLVDFKTGQIRDYYLQMGAYALACMDAYFSDEWTAHLLFVDAKEIVTHVFKRSQIESRLKDVVFRCKGGYPVQNDYCNWCRRFGYCPVTTNAVQELREGLPTLEQLACDDFAAHSFLSKLKIANDFADRLKELIKKRVETEPSEYFKYVQVTGRKVCYPLELGGLFSTVGWQHVLEIMPTIPASKAQELYKKFFGKDLPEIYVHTAAATSQLRLSKIDSRKQKTLK